MSSSEGAHDAAHLLGLRIGRHPKPDKTALPVVKLLGAGGLAQILDHPPAFGRRHRHAPDGPFASVRKGDAVTDVAPYPPRTLGDQLLLDRRQVVEKVSQPLEPVGDGWANALDPNRGRGARAKRA